MKSLLFALALAATACHAAPVPLFDGKSLDGWEGETTKVWRVHDGAIVGGSLEGNPANQFLATKKSYKNFLLRLEYKLVGTEGFVNGGVQFRSQRIKNPPTEMSGYQADIGAGYSGSLYDESRRNKVLLHADEALIKKLEKPGEWNSYELRVEGPRIRLTLNGTLTVDFTETDAGIAREGLIALQIHGGAKSEVSYRALTIEELPDIAAAKPIPEPENRFAAEPISPPVTTPFPGGKFTLGDHETVVLVGGTNFARDAKSGDLEGRLVQAYGAKKPFFRSMAVDADTVYLQEREQNFGGWRQQLEAVGATVVISQFGQMECLDGPARLPEFIAAYHRLLDEFSARTQRLVLVSPMAFEAPESPHLPNLTQRNADVRAYADAIRALAKQRNAIFVDLSADPPQRLASKIHPLTDNGLHLNADGLAYIATTIAKALGLPDRPAPAGDLRAAVIAKNRFWNWCWRPANWAFVYGDRTTQLFASAQANNPSLKETFAKHRPLLIKADADILAVAAGEKVPLEDAPAPVNAEPALTPEEELATFTIAPGYEVQLVASEKDGVVKPIQMSWDERGRLLIACSPGYPHPAAGAKPADFILMCEDTNGDGTFDKTWKYADGLTMVNGVEPGDGGIYVSDFDELLHFKDTDGDGRADQRRVVLSGFGTGDTHQLINSITHTGDGSLWFSQGLHVRSHVETPWGIARLDQAGLWRLRPRTLRLDPYFNNARAGANCWGVLDDDFGQIFHKSGDRPGGYYSVPGLVRAATGFAPAELDQAIGAIFKSDSKSNGLDLLGSRALPDDLQACAVLGGYFKNRVEVHRFIDDGAGFRTELLPYLITSSSTAFRPVDVSQGPDGAIYVCDFFNPIIGHYQASYVDPKRDKSHGRIWRITAKGRAPIKQPNLAAMAAPALLDQLASPERWTRTTARRLLFWKPTEEVLPALDAWVAKTTDESLLRQALGIYEAHETARPQLLRRLLESKDARIRAYATRTIGAWSAAVPDALALLRKSALDPAPRVRLEAAVAATYVPQPEAVEIAALASTQPRDKYLNYALTESVRALKPQWQPALASLTFGGNPAARDFVTKIGGAAPGLIHPGKPVYDALCLTCHQPNALGLPGVYPPLAGSEWVTGDSATLVKMLLHGLSGPITVKGDIFGSGNPIPMPPSGLNDQQIADVLSYVRTTFGNTAPAIPAEEVRTLREKHKDRTGLWTVEELAPKK
jgi:mono/diheme cytochrome c family protein/glucose/arabinose dehydrogenase